LCGWVAESPRYSSRLNVTTLEKSSASLRCRRTNSLYMPMVVLPVAKPSRIDGFLRMAWPTMRAASWASWSASGLRTSSIGPEVPIVKQDQDSDTLLNRFESGNSDEQDCNANRPDYRNLRIISLCRSER